MRAERAEARFPAMGSRAHVVVLGADARAHVAWAVARLAQLEQRWSRFRDGSEVSWCNRSAGVDVIVSADTVLLVERAIEGWEVTGGAYDPTVLGAVLRSGYTADFACLRASRSGVDRIDVDLTLGLGAGAIEVDRATRRVRIPAGTGFDPGGIGKGLAADLVAEELVAAGADGVCVNVGGDVRACGGARGEDWRVDLEDPVTGTSCERLSVRDGGVATSSPLRRRWVDSDGHDVHHLVDPRTGACARTAVRCVTVVATAAWQAEVLTKAAVLGDLDVVDRLGAAARVHEGGRVRTTRRWSDFATAVDEP